MTTPYGRTGATFSRTLIGVLMRRNKSLSKGLMMQIQQSADGSSIAGFSYLF